MATDLLDQSVPTEINKYDFRTESKAFFKARKGLDAEIVRQISDMKNEPDWMRDFRLQSLEIFNSKPMPRWGGKIDLDFQDIFYYLKPTDRPGPLLGRCARGNQKDVRSAGHSRRPKKNIWPA